MGDIFLKTLNMSIAASWLILAVVLLRFILKKAPKWVAVLLWGIVALRLVVPFSFESALSLIPSAETFNAHNIQYETPAINSGIPAVNNAVNPVLGETFAPNSVGSINPLYIWTLVVSAIWLVGIAAMLLYAVISYVRVRRSVAERVPYKENIFLCDHMKSPFILGLVRPKIYLPSNMDTMAMEPVIAHEKAHLARRDHWWKPLGFLILTVHWFNPLCWVAYVLLCRDIEMACDEKVIRQMDLDGKKQYSTALLECSVQRRLVTICPLAFGEVGVKERVKNVLNYKKPAFWLIVAAVIACAVVTVCFATNPASAENYIRLQSTHSTPPAAFFSLDLAEGVHGTVIAERWENGSCVSTNPVFMNNATQQIQLYLDPQDNGVNVQLGVDNGDAILENLSYPEDEKPVGWSFVSLDEGEKTSLQFGKDRIIAAMAFDFGTGVKSYSCDTLSADKKQVEDAAYMIVIRAILANGSDPIEVPMDELREKYPEYFELGTFKGLEVYVWQTAENDYRFGLMQGTNREKTLEEKLALKGATAEEMALILSTFDIEDKNIFVIPWQNPVSSYMVAEDMVKDPEYINNIRATLGLDGVSIGSDRGKDTPTTIGPDEAATTLSEEQTAIRKAILEHNKSSYPQEYDMACCSFTTLETLSGTPLVGSNTHKITYYGWALYEEYRVTDNGLETVSGSHVPVALSFDLDERGYTLTEYWEPRDGSYYAQDIREKFPAHIVEDGMDSQKFILQQTQECYAQAIDYVQSIAPAGLDTDKVIGSLIETICSGPALSSNPGDYIEEHPIEFRELTYYGRYTLKYCFTEFLKGGQTDLRGHIMRAAIDDIAPEARLKLYAETGQEYFDVWKDAAMSIREQHDMEWIEAHQPAIYLLLSMLGEA